MKQMMQLLYIGINLTSRTSLVISATKDLPIFIKVGEG